MSRTVVRWKPRSANSSLAAARSRSLVPPTNNCLKHSFHQGKPSIFCRGVTRWPLEEHPRAVRLAPFQRPGGAASGLLSPTRHASATDPAHPPGRAGRMRSAPARPVAHGTERAAATERAVRPAGQPGDARPRAHRRLGEPAPHAPPAPPGDGGEPGARVALPARSAQDPRGERRAADRKSTRLNSSHSQISYAVFCLKKKKKNNTR